MPEEAHELDLDAEAQATQSAGMEFHTLPMLDREVPDSQSSFTEAFAKLDALLCSGDDIVVHCRQGIGRAGLVASCLLVMQGMSPEEAIATVSEARGVSVPETPEQRRWIDEFALIQRS